MRPLLVAQASSALVAPLATAGFGNAMMVGLNEALASPRACAGANGYGVAGLPDRRNAAYAGCQGWDREVFARVVGGRSEYQTNLSWQNYGQDYSQDAVAVQSGFNFLRLDGIDQGLRLGVAATVGTINVSPKTSFIERSRLSMDAYGLALTAAWYNNQGWYANGIVSTSLYTGNVSTLRYGKHAGRVRSNGLDMSLEVGKTINYANGLIFEPMVRLNGQVAEFKDRMDADGIMTSLGLNRSLSAYAGARLGMLVPGTASWVPYIALAAQHTWSDASKVRLGNHSFELGELGSSINASIGAKGMVTQSLQVYGEATYQQRVGGYGTNSFNGFAGIRYFY